MMTHEHKFSGPSWCEDPVVLWFQRVSRHLFLTELLILAPGQAMGWSNVTKKSLTCCICCWSLFLWAGSKIRVWGTFSVWGLTLSTSCCCLAEAFLNFSCSRSSFIVRCCSFSKLANGSSNLPPTGRQLNVNNSLGPTTHPVPANSGLRESA